MYLPPEIIERCRTERGEIQLQRRGHHYELISNGTFLMATYNGASERLLVRAALDAIAKPRSVLLGGLGVGFSLAEALADDRVKMVKVIEIEQKVIEWNQSYLAPFSNGGLTDDRTEVIHSDLLEWIQCAKEWFDVICLDVDNGPDWTVSETNLELYECDGLERLSRLLSPDGVIAFWSATRSPSFAERLQTSFAKVSELACPLETTNPDYVYLAEQPMGRKRFTREARHCNGKGYLV